MNNQSEQAGPSSQSDNLDIHGQNVIPCFLPDQDCIAKIIANGQIHRKSIKNGLV